MSTNRMVPTSSNAANKPRSRMASELMNIRLKKAPTVVILPMSSGVTTSRIISSLFSVLLKCERKWMG